MSVTKTNKLLSDILGSYLALFPNEASGLTLLQAQLSRNEGLIDRKNFTGHVTGSAFVLSPDRQSLLLIHHNILQRWLQPGGHAELIDADPLATARREATEETAVELAEYLPIDSKHPLVPIDINSHSIPENKAKAEAEHYHHDFRYVFVAANMSLKHQVEEVTEARWFLLDEVPSSDLAPVVAKFSQFELTN